MLKRIVEEKWLTAKAVFGLWPANSVGDDVEVVDRSDGASREATLCTSCASRPTSPSERPDFCLADFIAPKDSGRQDWIGAFAVTAGIGIEPHVARFEADHDDYNAILLKALADRLAEALAERLHQRVRKEFWGYAADEIARRRCADRTRSTAASALRPAIRPARSTARRRRMFRLLDAERERRHAADRELRDVPRPPRCRATTSAIRAASISWSAGCRKEQVEDYARRKGVTLAQAERWLASNLDYDPE